MCFYNYEKIFEFLFILSRNNPVKTLKVLDSLQRHINLNTKSDLKKIFAQIFLSFFNSNSTKLTISNSNSELIRILE